MRKTVPAVIVITPVNCQQRRLLYCEYTEISWPIEESHVDPALADDTSTTVAYRVYSLIFFRPLSPSFWSFSRGG